MEEVEKALSYFGTMVLGLVLGAGTAFLALPHQWEQDVNRDGRADYVIDDKKNSKVRNTYFIKREDGTFDRCMRVSIEGKTFYNTLDGKFSYTTNAILIDNQEAKSRTLSKEYVIYRNETNIIPGKTLSLQR